MHIQHLLRHLGSVGGQANMMNDALPLQILYVGDGSVSRRLLQIGKLINAVDKAKIDIIRLQRL